MSIQADSIQVIAAVFPTEAGATETADQLKSLKDAGTVDIIDGVVITKAKDSGKVDVDELTWSPTGKGATAGAIAGAIVGLFVPPAWLATTALGAAIGAGTGKLVKVSQEDDQFNEFLTSVEQDLEPGTSAILAIIEDKVLQQIVDGLEGYSNLYEQTLSADAVAALNITAIGETTNA